MVLHRRNLSCIGCGCPRSNNSSSPIMNSSLVPNSRITPSPRFASANNPTPFMHSEYDLFYATAPGSTSSAPCPSPHANAQKTVTRPLLTPSGRAFAIGGRVQNISRDPLSPCIMYWPENEPFPEQGQIRPGNLSGIPVRFFYLPFFFYAAYTIFLPISPATSNPEYW